MSMGLVEGQNLGAYEILASIGAGGMGEVYRARDTRLDREVAIKILPKDQTSPDRMKRFIGEARAAARLNHPNIIAIYDIAEAGGIHFIVMEYVPGKTLADSIPPTGLELTVALSFARQIAASLARAHASGIVHRDLKPANIMVTSEGTIKVLDFGLAKLYEPSDPGNWSTRTATTPGAIMGTAGYMSPEQAAGRSVDLRSDIFSLGLVLYEMISGQQAFRGETPISTIAAILHTEPRPLREVAPRVPGDLERIVSRCLLKDPEQRFRSAVDLKMALENLDAKASAACTPSIAVLPFSNLSADRENEYFSDGLAEEIINALTQVSGLRVTARSSAFSFRGKDIETAEIGRRLGVAHLLEGSVRRSGNRIRVTAQLVKAADGFQLWSERFDREMTDVFAVQDEIAQGIVQKLKGKFSGQSMACCRTRHSPNLEAYSAYLRGRHFLWRPDAVSLERAREHFEKAIALDPDYALALVGTALSLFIYPAIAKAGTEECLLEAKRLLEQALRIDDTLAEAHALLGAVRVSLDFDWEGAAREFQYALATETVSAEVLDLYGRWFLWPQGRLEEALAVYERSRQIDPLIPIFVQHIAEALMCMEQYDQAIQQARKALEIDRHFWPAHTLIGWIHVMLGKPQDAIEAFETAGRMEPQSSINYCGLVGAYAVAGQKEKARELAGSIFERAQKEFVSPHLQAVVCHFLGEHDRMFELLNQAADQRDQTLFLFPNLGFFHHLRTDPRFQSLLRKMNLAHHPESKRKAAQT